MSIKKRNFKKNLEIGNEKESFLVEILNLCGVPAKLNNDINVKDIDIELINDGALMDCKYRKTPFFSSEQYVNIKPEDCITVSIESIRSYDKKEKLERKKSWVAFIVDYKEYGVYELFFVPNSQLLYLIDNKIGVRENSLHFDKKIGRNMYQFLNLINQFREIKKKQNNM